MYEPLQDTHGVTDRDVEHKFGTILFFFRCIGVCAWRKRHLLWVGKLQKFLWAAYLLVYVLVVVCAIAYAKISARSAAEGFVAICYLLLLLAFSLIYSRQKGLERVMSETLAWPTEVFELCSPNKLDDVHTPHEQPKTSFVPSLGVTSPTERARVRLREHYIEQLSMHIKTHTLLLFSFFVLLTAFLTPDFVAISGNVVGLLGLIVFVILFVFTADGIVVAYSLTAILLSLQMRFLLNVLEIGLAEPHAVAALHSRVAQRAQRVSKNFEWAIVPLFLLFTVVMLSFVTGRLHFPYLGLRIVGIILFVAAELMILLPPALVAAEHEKVVACVSSMIPDCMAAPMPAEAPRAEGHEMSQRVTAPSDTASSAGYTHITAADAGIEEGELAAWRLSSKTRGPGRPGWQEQRDKYAKHMDRVTPAELYALLAEDLSVRRVDTPAEEVVELAQYMHGNRSGAGYRLVGITITTKLVTRIIFLLAPLVLGGLADNLS